MPNNKEEQLEDLEVTESEDVTSLIPESLSVISKEDLVKQPLEVDQQEYDRRQV